MITPEIIERLKLSIAENDIHSYHWPYLSTKDREAFIVQEDNGKFKVYLRSRYHWFHAKFPYELLNDDKAIEFIKKVVEKEWSKLIKS